MRIRSVFYFFLYCYFCFISSIHAENITLPARIKEYYLTNHIDKLLSLCKKNKLQQNIRESCFMYIGFKAEEAFRAGDFQRAFFLNRQNILYDSTVKAESFIAHAYYYGWGTLSDPFKALDIYRKIVTKANTPIPRAMALNNIGIIYETQGDMIKAMEYYQKAADLNLAKGKFNLARIYAGQFYQKTILSKLPGGKFKLTNRYIIQKNPTENLTKAYTLINAAMKKGFREESTYDGVIFEDTDIQAKKLKKSLEKSLQL